MVKRQCVFLDRDGVINRKAPPGDYIRVWRDFRLLDNVVDWIRLFNALDLLVIIVTNQRGVARGLIRPEDLDDIHTRMRQSLARLGAHVDDLFCCPHELDSCDCRKPKPGLVLQAQRKWNIDVGRSLMIGDSESDRLLAENCGMKFIAVDEGRLA